MDDPFIPALYKNITLRDVYGVPAGWYGICGTLLQDLESLGVPIKIVQMKEKFGTLRVYTWQELENTPLIDHFIQAAEKLSSVTCQHCGALGATIRTERMWWATECDDCSVNSEREEADGNF